MDRPGVRQVPEGSGEQRKMEETGCEVICGAPTTLTVKGLMMMDDENNKMPENQSFTGQHQPQSKLHQCVDGVFNTMSVCGWCVSHCVVWFMLNDLCAE